MEATKELTSYSYRQAYSNGDPSGFVVQETPAHPICNVDDESTARLFAAAPDLLAACESSLTLIDNEWLRTGPDKPKALILRLKSAIAKAKS